MSIGTLPLSPFTVLDLCHARAGPTAVRQLADWGAHTVEQYESGIVIRPRARYLGPRPTKTLRVELRAC